jgi:hypothetical protein
MSRKQLNAAHEATHKRSIWIRNQAAVNIMSRAKRPTGWLASHIAAYTNKLGNKIIGIIQVENTPYDKYIESGGGSFKGYHYMRDAYKIGKKAWINDLLKIFK